VPEVPEISVESSARPDEGLQSPTEREVLVAPSDVTVIHPSDQLVCVPAHDDDSSTSIPEVGPTDDLSTPWPFAVEQRLGGSSAESVDESVWHGPLT
jgi:hypothetical protein